MPIPSPNTAVVAARGRRAGAAAARNVRMEWFIREISDKVKLTMRQRVGVVTQFLKNKVVNNISISVVKGTGPRGGRVVTGRSSPGEFPRTDTNELMRTIFGEVRETVPGIFDGFIGTPLDYGLILETKMNRSFLVRTLTEELSTIRRILVGPIV